MKHSSLTQGLPHAVSSPLTCWGVYDTSLYSSLSLNSSFPALYLLLPPPQPPPL